MNYFTPLRSIALQDCSTSDAMDRADDVWEQASQQYDAYLDSIRSTLPASVVRLLEGFYLHDAVVLSIGRQDELFVVSLQLDVPPHELLTISYTLADAPTVDESAFSQVCSTRPLWLYEELEAVPVSGRETYRHSILLSNGWEVRVPFRDVQLTTAQAVFPVVSQVVAARSA